MYNMNDYEIDYVDGKTTYTLNTESITCVVIKIASFLLN